MPLMEWTSQLSVGVAEFDEEHKQIIVLINDLFDAVQDGRGHEALGHTLDALMAYTNSHFTHEERRLTEINFPPALLEDHRREHEALTRRVLEIQCRHHAGGGSMLSLEVMSFLKNWLTKHIQGTDRRYGEHFMT